MFEATVGKILIVDSALAHHAGVAARLSASGYRVLPATGAAGTIRLLRAERPDLVIADAASPETEAVARALISEPALTGGTLILLPGDAAASDTPVFAGLRPPARVVSRDCSPEALFDTIVACLSGQPDRLAVPPASVAARGQQERPSAEPRSGDRLADCLAELSRQVLEPMAAGGLFEALARLAREALSADYCRVTELVRESSLVLAAECPGPPAASGPLPRPASALAEYAAGLREPVIVPRTDRESRFSARSLFDDSGLVSAIAVLLESPRQTYAVLEAFSRKPERFQQEDAGFLQTAARIVVAGLERSRAAESLRAAQTHLDCLISSSPSVIYALTVRGRTLEPNTVGENIARVTGYSVREVLRPEWWREHAYPDELLLEIAGGSVGYSGSPLVREYQITRADGKAIWLRDESRLLVGDTGAPLEIVGSLSDVTAHKALEEQFRGAQKMEAFGRLAGGFAHDFNNLLTVISGFTELELGEPDLNPRTRHALTTISKAAAGAVALSRQLVAFSRREVSSRQVVDLGSVAGNLLKMLRRVIGADIRLHTGIAAGLPPVYADIGMMEQILLHLAVNARDAMPRGGDLTIGIQKVVLPAGDPPRGADRRSGEFVRLEVTDTGLGMSGEVLAHLFEPSYGTRGAGGTGLGLATVHGIVLQHNGWIEVQSAPGRGACFHIFLPRAREDHESAQEPAALEWPSATSPGILLVEDNEDVRGFLELFLADRGFVVHAVGCAAAAEAMLSGPDRDIDLLMTDIVLPGGVSGLELAEKAARLRPGLRVLFASGHYPDPENREPAMEEGLNFVRKPFDLGRLEAAIGNCLRRSLP